MKASVPILVIAGAAVCGWESSSSYSGSLEFRFREIVGNGTAAKEVQEH